MNPLDPKSEVNEFIEINQADRWQVCLRLWELAIPCWCEPGRPLRVQINSATAAAQVWSVVRQLTASRPELVSWLERCWHRA
ncbi:MAG TPA: Asr1405/Asl0597 family protein [Candidatus Caenarcaniphilales bacterium]